MTHLDLQPNDKVMYQDGDEKVQATVLKIDTDKELVYFKDWEDFEWEEKFEDIPEVVKRIIN
jgi:hypothetical protein